MEFLKLITFLTAVTGALSANRKLCQSVGMEYRIGIITEREENIVSYVARNEGVALIGSEYKKRRLSGPPRQRTGCPTVTAEKLPFKLCISKRQESYASCRGCCLMVPRMSASRKNERKQSGRRPLCFSEFS